MLNIDEIQNGIVIDHIKAGTALNIYNLLNLGKYDFPVAIIKNARSNKYGKKDIIKIEGDTNGIPMDILAYVDPAITIVEIRNSCIVNKYKPTRPKRLVNVIKCTNPRCITSIEEECDHIFELSKNGLYRCAYCEQVFTVKNK